MLGSQIYRMYYPSATKIFHIYTLGTAKNDTKPKNVSGEFKCYVHDDLIKWKHYWPVNSPHKGQWRGALMFSLICNRPNDWVNSREAGDLGRHRAHYDVIEMDYQDNCSTRAKMFTCLSVFTSIYGINFVEICRIRWCFEMTMTIVYLIVYSGVHQRKHQSSASLAFVWGPPRGPVNSRTKGQ